MLQLSLQRTIHKLMVLGGRRQSYVLMYSINTLDDADKVLAPGRKNGKTALAVG